MCTFKKAQTLKITIFQLLSAREKIVSALGGVMFYSVNSFPDFTYWTTLPWLKSLRIKHVFQKNSCYKRRQFYRGDFFGATERDLTVLR